MVLILYVYKYIMQYSASYVFTSSLAVCFSTFLGVEEAGVFVTFSENHEASSPVAALNLWKYIIGWKIYEYIHYVIHMFCLLCKVLPLSTRKVFMVSRVLWMQPIGWSSFPMFLSKLSGWTAHARKKIYRPGNWTWNQTMKVWKMIFLFNYRVFLGFV